MKKIWILILIVCAFASGAAPTLVTTEKKMERDGKQILSVDQKVNFENGVMVYHYTLDPEEEKFIFKKWDDFAIGLLFGSVNNGSWSATHFLSIMSADNRDLVKSGSPKLYLLNFKGGTMAEFNWKNGTSLRIIQLSGMTNWLFMKVKTQETPTSVVFRAYPGGSHWHIAGRERHVTDSVKDVISEDNQTTVPFEKPGLALYNKNYMEQHGNFIVYEPGQIQSIGISGTNAVSIAFRPASGKNEFTFALSYFKDQQHSEAIPRFLTEQLPNIVEQLRKVDWAPALDIAAYAKEFEIVGAMVSKAGSAELKKEFDEIKTGYETATGKNDFSAIGQAMEKLEKFRAKTGKSTLDRFN